MTNDSISGKLIIFDFDGVLVNTSQFCYELNCENNPDLTMEDFKNIFNGNFFDRGEDAQGNEKHISPNPEYNKSYYAKIRDFTTPLGVQRAIEQLSQKNKLAIISSGSEGAIKYFLEKEELLSCFNDILGFETHTSKIVKINLLLEKYSIAPRDAVFITDTLGDIVEATATGIKSIGVTWGLHDVGTLQKGNPSIIIDEHQILKETICQILNN